MGRYKQWRKRKVLCGYKVCALTSGQLWSWVPTCKGSVRYSTEDWTLRKANFGPLAVFVDRPSAVRFYKGQRMPGTRIFRCAYIRSLPEHCVGYWEGRREYVRAKNAPSGKDFADAVCLLEQVWPKPKGGV